jgi:putative endonuclease
MAAHNDLGKQGEDAACQYLITLSYEILARNYRYAKAEIDIIAQVGATLVFVEVKTRSSTSYGHPEDSVTATKQRLLLDAMDNYLEEQKISSEPRFDIIAVTIIQGKTDIHHIIDAFYH